VPRIRSFDGAEIAYHDVGAGRPVLLLHGYLADAASNWLTPGIADALAAAGFRSLMPDLRGHGASIRSHDPADYPADAFARDQVALLEQLGIHEYDLVGYSLGAMVASRLQVLDGRARHLVLGGTAEDGLLERGANWGPFLRALADPVAARKRPGDREILAFAESIGGDARALLLAAEARTTTSREELHAFDCRTLLLSGAGDAYIESLEPLQKLIPGSEIQRPPGDHVSTVSQPEFAAAIVAFLRAERSG